MNKDLLILIFAFVATFSSLRYISPQRERNALKTHENKQISSVSKEHTYKKKEIDNWNAFINALVWVESKGKWDAIGTSNDVGVLQITPICVKQANIYVGYDKYSLDDRLDSLKSVEMFNVIQDRMNPEHDLHFALKIWNSKAPISYHEKVMNEYNKRKNNEKVL